MESGVWNEMANDNNSNRCNWEPDCLPAWLRCAIRPLTIFRSQDLSPNDTRIGFAWIIPVVFVVLLLRFMVKLIKNSAITSMCDRMLITSVQFNFPGSCRARLFCFSLSLSPSRLVSLFFFLYSCCCAKIVHNWNKKKRERKRHQSWLTTEMRAQCKPNRRRRYSNVKLYKKIYK